MVFKGIDKKAEGKFITRYDINYQTEDGKAVLFLFWGKDSRSGETQLISIYFCRE